MDQDQLRALLAQVSAGAVDVDAAMERMRHLPFEDLGFAKVDHHRALRHGIPEVVFGTGKTPEQTSAIVGALLARASNVLVTRAPAETAERLKQDYWLYAVFNCGSNPELHVVRDPARLGWQPIVKIEHYQISPSNILAGEAN